MRRNSIMPEIRNTEDASNGDLEGQTVHTIEQEFEWIDEATRIKKEKKAAKCRNFSLEYHTPFVGALW